MWFRQSVVVSSRRLASYLRRGLLPLRLCGNLVDALRRRSLRDLLRLVILVAALLALAPLVTWALGTWRWLIFLGVAQSLAVAALGWLNRLRRRAWNFTTRTCNLRVYSRTPAVLASNPRSL
jgi:hypothetical protein